MCYTQSIYIYYKQLQILNINFSYLLLDRCKNLIELMEINHRNLSQIRDIIVIFKKKPEIRVGVSDIKQQVSSIIKKSMILGIRCEICYQQKNQEQFETIAECQHRYCGDCLLYYISAKLALNNITLNCINQNCQNQFNEHCLIFMRLNENQKNLYYKLKKQQVVFKNKNQKFCPTQDCQGILNLTEKPKIKCKICNIKFCSNCLLPFHNGSCDNYAQVYLEDNYHFMKCKSCNSIVQKIDGCDHITCRCSYQFCYLCGGFWKIDHTCPEQAQRTFCYIVGIYLRYIFFIIFGFIAFIILSILIFTGFIFLAPFKLGLQIYQCVENCPIRIFLILLTYPLLMIVALIRSFLNFERSYIIQIFRIYLNHSRYILTLR